MFSSKNKIDNLISFQIDEIKQNADQQVIIQAHSVSKSGTRPSCNTTSNRVHSTYLRFPQSLPILGMQTHFHLKANRFFCDNDQCSKRTFAEQIEKIVPRYALRSVELNYVLTGLSFEASAEAVARICSRLQIKISPDSVLRFLRTTSMPSYHPYLRVVGVDDWAFKKGQRYGTILVDIETNRI